MEDKPLLDSEGTKRPTLLYIIIAILAVAVIALIIVVATKKCEDCECDCKTETNPPIPYNNDHFIPINESFFTNKTEGSYALQGTLNHFDSPYFKMVDIYNMESNANRTILSRFKTYQQTSEYSSHCAAIIMALTYYGDIPPGERDCMIKAGIEDPDNFVEDDESFRNFTMKKFEDYLNSLGYNTTSNDNFTEENFPYNNSLKFSNWIKGILAKNETILVNWADWGGTVSVIIGVDSMGNSSPDDHVIILADTYDTCDHLNDGYTLIGLDKFYYNWQYNNIYYLTDERYNRGRFIVIHRKAQS